MAKVDTNKVVAALRGALGGLVIRQMPDGSVVISTAPHYGGKKRKSTGKQKMHQDRFKEAAMYARYAAKVHLIYAELARGTVKSPYNFALSDWFHPPVIHQVQYTEDRILVRASDNILVSKVRVTVQNEDGAVVGKGEAVRQDGDWWEYVPNTPWATATADAWDLAGNKTSWGSPILRV